MQGWSQVLLKRVAREARQLLIRTGLDRAWCSLSNGAPPASIRARLTPQNLAYPEPTIRRLTRDGIRYELDISDYMQWCTYYGIAIEPRQALYSLVSPGQTAIDVGTNIGEVLLNFGKLVGPGGAVIGFEPNPPTYQACLRNLALNHFPNVRLFNLGLGRQAGKSAIGRPNRRNSGEDRVLAGGQSGGVEIEIVTLDEFATRHDLRRMDLIKIDVEGFEMNVLAGAQACIERFRPSLFVEINDSNLRAQGGGARELVGWLEARSYRITDAESGVPVSSTEDFAGRHFDIVCRPR
jgi:FkbM family methyltransferase